MLLVVFKMSHSIRFFINHYICCHLQNISKLFHALYDFLFGIATKKSDHHLTQSKFHRNAITLHTFHRERLLPRTGNKGATQDTHIDNGSSQNSNAEEYEYVFYVNNEGQPRRLLLYIHFANSQTTGVGCVDTLSSTLIFHGCCAVVHIDPRCTLTLYQLDNFVKN